MNNPQQANLYTDLDFKNKMLLLLILFQILIFISSLRILGNVFWSYSFSPPTFATPSLFLYTQLCFLVCYFKFFKSNLCCLYVLGHVTIHWKLASLPAAVKCWLLLGQGRDFMLTCTFNAGILPSLSLHRSFVSCHTHPL